MSERLTSLHESEVELLNRSDEFDRVLAIDALDKVASKLDRVNEYAEGVRQASPELAVKIGAAAREIAMLLDQLNVPVRASIEQEEPQPSLPMVDVTEQVAPLVVTNESEVPQASTEPVEQQPEVATELNDRAKAWLREMLSDDWPAVLGLSETASVDDIAMRITTLIEIRKPNTPELAQTRIKEYLLGKSYDEIARMTNTTYANMSQFLKGSLRKRLAKLSAEHRTMPAAEPQPQSPPQLAQVQRPVVVPSPRTFVQPGYTPLRTAPGQKAEQSDDPENIVQRRENLTTTIVQQLELSGVEGAALNGFLDVKTKGDMTSSKEMVVDKVRRHIRPLIDSPDVGLTAEARTHLRRAFGAYTMMGDAQDKPPIPLKELVKSTRFNGQSQRIEQEVIEALEMIFAPTKKQKGHTVEQFLAAEADLLDQLYSNALRKVAQSGEYTEQEIEALKSYIDEIEEGKQRAVQEVSGALQKLQRKIVSNEGVSSGDAQVDTATKRFAMGSAGEVHLSVFAQQLAKDDSSVTLKKLLYAGLYSLYAAEPQERAS